jgi:hypothetical protein
MLPDAPGSDLGAEAEPGSEPVHAASDHDVVRDSEGHLRGRYETQISPIRVTCS